MLIMRQPPGCTDRVGDWGTPGGTRLVIVPESLWLFSGTNESPHGHGNPIRVFAQAQE